MALVPILLAGHHMEPTTIWKIKMKWRHLRPHLVTDGYDNCISFWVKPIDQWQEDTSTAIPTLTGCTMWLGGDFLLRQSHLANLDPAWAWMETPTLLNKFDAFVWRVSWSVMGHLLFGRQQCADRYVTI